MKIIYVGLRKWLYNFCSFFTFTSLWGSLLNENSIGDSSNFLQLLQFLTFTAMFQTVLSVCNANMCIYNFPGYRTYSNTFHIDTDVFIHTLFIFKYVNDINLCQDIQCNLNIQSTEHQCNQHCSM